MVVPGIKKRVFGPVSRTARRLGRWSKAAALLAKEEQQREFLLVFHPGCMCVWEHFALRIDTEPTAMQSPNWRLLHIQPFVILL